MAMDSAKMADEIKKAGGFAGPNSKELKAFAKAIVDEIKANAKVNFPPGNVKGTAPSSGGPLQKGEAQKGKITGVLAASLGTRIVSILGQKPSSLVVKMAAAIAAHILTGVVNIKAPGVTGACTNTASNPGTFTGQGAKGKISGLSGPTLAKNIATPDQAPPMLLGMCNAIVKHIQDNAEVSITGCTGACASGGGPLQAGVNSASKVQ